jgi:hypothetical protein
MRLVEVVMLEPGRELLIAFLGVEIGANLGPLAEGGLNEAFGLAVGARGIGTGEAVLDAELEAGGAEVAGAIARAVVGEQAVDGDAVLGIEGDSGCTKAMAVGLCWSGSMREKAMREWSLMATCSACQPANCGRPRRRPSPRMETC